MYNVEINTLPYNLIEAMDLINAMNAWCKELTEDKRLSHWNYADFNENGIVYRFEDQGMAVLFSLKWVK
jgi:hypothetical protein